MNSHNLLTGDRTCPPISCNTSGLHSWQSYTQSMPFQLPSHTLDASIQPTPPPSAKPLRRGRNWVLFEAASARVWSSRGTDGTELKRLPVTSLNAYWLLISALKLTLYYGVRCLLIYYAVYKRELGFGAKSQTFLSTQGFRHGLKLPRLFETVKPLWNEADLEHLMDGSCSLMPCVWTLEKSDMTNSEKYKMIHLEQLKIPFRTQTTAGGMQHSLCRIPLLQPNSLLPFFFFNPEAHTVWN